MPTSPGPVRIGLKTTSPVHAYDRVLWFVGQGPPPSPDVIGAKIGDMYLDSTTDDVYRLGS